MPRQDLLGHVGSPEPVVLLGEDELPIKSRDNDEEQQPIGVLRPLFLEVADQIAFIVNASAPVSPSLVPNVWRRECSTKSVGKPIAARVAACCWSSHV